MPDTSSDRRRWHAVWHPKVNRMSPPQAEDPRLPRRARLDLALVELVRIVRADGWAPDPAARELRTRVRDDGFVLRMLRARIAKAMLERPSVVGSRAAATLDRALPHVAIPDRRLPADNP